MQAETQPWGVGKNVECIQDQFEDYVVHNSVNLKENWHGDAEGDVCQ